MFQNPVSPDILPGKFEGYKEKKKLAKVQSAAVVKGSRLIENNFKMIETGYYQ